MNRSIDPRNVPHCITFRHRYKMIITLKVVDMAAAEEAADTEVRHV